jgi:hypothetical protein
MGQTGLPAASSIAQAGLSAVSYIGQTGLPAVSSIAQAGLQWVSSMGQTGLSTSSFVIGQTGLPAASSISQAGLPTAFFIGQAGLPAVSSMDQTGLPAAFSIGQTGLPAASSIGQTGLPAAFSIGQTGLPAVLSCMSSAPAGGHQAGVQTVQPAPAVCNQLTVIPAMSGGLPAFVVQHPYTGHLVGFSSTMSAPIILGHAQMPQVCVVDRKRFLIMRTRGFGIPFLLLRHPGSRFYHDADPERPFLCIKHRNSHKIVIFVEEMHITH